MPPFRIILASFTLAACARSAPSVQQPSAPTAGAHAGEAAGGPGNATTQVADPGRREFKLARLAMALALQNNTLIWADVAGALWMMPTDGSEPPKQLSEQHRDGFATHPFVAGSQVLAKSKDALLTIELPSGKITKVPVTGVPGRFEGAVGDATTIYLTVFNHDQIVRVPIGGGAAQHVIDVPKAVLALHGATLYIASYTTGELVAMPITGGARHTIVRNLNKPTAVVVDDMAAYVYTEGDRRVVRIELSNGATSVLGDQLENSDELVIVGDYIYTVSWPHKLVRLAKVASATVTLADDLFQPRGIVHDDHAIYVTADSPPRIVRIPFAAP